MKKRVNILFYSLVFLLTACSTPSTTSSSSESESSSDSFSFIDQEEKQNEGYSWYLEEGEAYKGDVPVTISSNIENDDLKLYIDGNNSEKYHSSSDKILASLSYELDPDHPANTESVEACQNTIRLNDKYVDVLHNDESLTVDFDSDKFLEGENILTLTIGYVYLMKEFDKKNVKYKLGWGDDFRVRKLGIQLSDGTFIKPHKMIGYYADENIKKYVTKEMDVDPDEYYWLGDGWGSDYYLAHINHPVAEYERPFAIDYYFNYEKKATVKNYNISTTDLDDGNHIFTGVSGVNHILQNHITVDNTAPVISQNVHDNMRITKRYPYSIKVEDATSDLKSTKIKLDGKVVKEVSLTDLSFGPHSVTVTAEDNAGNKIADTSCFNIVGEANILEADVKENVININKEYEGEVTFEESNKLSLNYETTDDKEQVSEKSNVEQTYTIDVQNITKDVLVSYDGSTQEGEDLLFEAYNMSTGKYESVYVGKSGVNNFKISPEDYLTEENQINLRISPRKVGNGSNKMIWGSDIQYLAKTIPQFQDLDADYGKLMQYMADEYKDNNLAYVINTGDIVDDNPEYGEEAIAEWEHASAAYKAVDKVGLPYGVLAGNHDVGSTVSALQYDYYWSYFGTSRTGNTNYYGQSLNNNACHYDLITVGNFDFVVVYLGYGVEGDLDTIAWANKVLKAFPERNAILCTHAYLDNDGKYDEESRAQVIYDNIVEPNDNVCMVFCGHTDASTVVRKKVNDTRVVYEIISCYQFVESTTDNIDMSKTSHLTNGYKCNGEGWIKDITVKDDGQLYFHTFSPVLESHYFSSNNGKTYEMNDYFLKLDLKKKQNVLKTNSINFYQAGETIEETKTTSSYTRNQTDSIVYVSDQYGSYTFVA